MKIKERTIYVFNTFKEMKEFTDEMEKQGYNYVGNGDVLFYKKYDAIRISSSELTGFGTASFYNANGYSKSHEIVNYADFKKENTNKAKIIFVGNMKVVFNPPYVIVTDGRFKGKAKCNPSDKWDSEIGLEIASQRFKNEKQYYFDSLIREE